MKQKVKSLAKDIYDNHFRVAQSQPRGVVAKLKSIVDEMNKAGMCKIRGKKMGFFLKFSFDFTEFFFFNKRSSSNPGTTLERRSYGGFKISSLSPKRRKYRFGL